jgi:hypothetical protein
LKISLALGAAKRDCLDARSQGILLTMFEEGIKDEIYGSLEVLNQDIYKNLNK